jgi:hypothetical protein
MCAKLGGFAMMAYAMNGTPVSGSGSMHDFQHPSNIPEIMVLFSPMSPAFIVENLGIMPGFFTMYCST